MPEPTPRLWRPEEPLVLGSTSPVRRALLADAGLIVETEAPEVDERRVEAAMPAGCDPGAIALRLAMEKALAVSRRRPRCIVVGADQTLACGDEAFHKPRDRDEAREQITRLSGRTHRLHSAVALAQNGQIVKSCVDEARLTMRPLSRATIERYLMLAGDKAVASVGGYQVEGLGIHLFERIEGDHATVLGLALLPLLAALRDMDLLSL